MSTSSLIPLAIASSVTRLSYTTEGWNLSTASGSDESACRRFVKRIEFETPFGSTPVVQAGLAGFDLDQRDSARLKITVQEIDAGGFDLEICSWNGSRVYGVDVSWIAIGS